MTEIQWIINLLTNHPLDESVKRLCLERIGEVEKRLIEQRPSLIGNPYQNGPIGAIPMQVQIPSTPIGQPPISAAQARDMAVQVHHSPTPVPQPLPKPPSPEVLTGVGNGTQIRGKRKF